MDASVIDIIVRLLNDVGAPAVYLVGLVVLWRRLEEHTRMLEAIVNRCLEELSERDDEQRA